MKSTKVLMMPKPKVVKVADPVVIGVNPLPDDAEPFMLKKRSPEETMQYNDGFAVGFQVNRMTTPRVRHGNVAGLKLRSRVIL